MRQELTIGQGIAGSGIIHLSEGRLSPLFDRLKREIHELIVETNLLERHLTPIERKHGVLNEGFHTALTAEGPERHDASDEMRADFGRSQRDLRILATAQGSLRRANPAAQSGGAIERSASPLTAVSDAVKGIPIRKVVRALEHLGLHPVAGNLRDCLK